MSGSARRITVEFLGDGKNLSGELTSLQNKTGKFGSFMKSAGKAAAIGLGAGLVVAGAAAVKFGKAAAEDAQAADLLKGALERNAGATKKQVADVEDWISAIGRAKGVADDDLRPALSRLVTATHDVGKAQVLAQVAMDVSAGTGKSLEAVSTALMKAQNGQVSSLSRLGINTKLTAEEQHAMAAASVAASKGSITMEQALKTASTQTITMDQAVARMSDTFGGAASDKAETFQGKMDRLKLMLSETGEAIGYKLIPIGMKLMDWITGSAIPGMQKFGDWLEVHVVPILQEVGHWISDTVVPAVQKFAGEMQSGEGAGGKFADALGKVRSALEKAWDILQPVFEFMANNKTVVATFAGVILTVAAGVKVWSAAQAVLNAVMAANPLGLVVLAVAALAAGLVYAYKKSETFRDVVDTAFDVVGKAGRSLWNDFLQPALSFIVNGIGKVIEGAADMLDALSHIPGFGWAKTAADKMHAAADAAKAVADNINKIPSTKTVDVNVRVNTSAIDKVQHQINTLGGSAGRLAAGAKSSGPWGVGTNDAGPGAALIDSIVKGIDKGKVKLDTVFGKLKDYIKKHQDSLADLMGKRNAVVDAFRGFTSSIFGTDVSTGDDGVPKTIQALLDAGSQREANAAALGSNVQALLDKGLSKDLLQQMIDAGEAGAQQIALLASGTQDQINQANADNDATRSSLEKAGLAVGDAIYGAGIAQEQASLKLADTVKAGLKDLLDLQDKNTIVELHLDGHIILASLKKIKRQNGGHLGLGDADRD